MLPLKKVLYITTILFYTISFGQTKITGKLIDAEDGQPLIGAQIIILPQEKGFITNNTGGFEISGNPEYKSLQVYYLGYVSQTEPLQEYSPAGFAKSL
ncbi:MAG: carboxypeptidase-like regulatory domain-containing protein [Flavobacteriaceae bacterium]